MESNPELQVLWQFTRHQTFKLESLKWRVEAVLSRFFRLMGVQQVFSHFFLAYCSSQWDKSIRLKEPIGTVTTHFQNSQCRKHHPCTSPFWQPNRWNRSMICLRMSVTGQAAAWHVQWAGLRASLPIPLPLPASAAATVRWGEAGGGTGGAMLQTLHTRPPTIQLILQLHHTRRTILPPTSPPAMAGVPKRQSRLHSLPFCQVLDGVGCTAPKQEAGGLQLLPDTVDSRPLAASWHVLGRWDPQPGRAAASAVGAGPSPSPVSCFPENKP